MRPQVVWSSPAENCDGPAGPSGNACCMPKGHAGPHRRPILAWEEWGGICAAITLEDHERPIACAFRQGHEGRHSWALPGAAIR